MTRRTAIAGTLLAIPLAIAAWGAAMGTVRGPAVLVAAIVLTVLPWTIRDARRRCPREPVDAFYCYRRPARWRRRWDV